MPPAKPNQQLINQVVAQQREGDGAALFTGLRALGLQLRAALAGLPLPLLAVRSHFSLLEGTASPNHWGEALAALHGEDKALRTDRRGGNFPGDAAAVHLASEALRSARAARAERARLAALGQTVAAPIAPGTVSRGAWGLLADRDLLGLPAAIADWGRGRVGVGATVAGGADEDVLLLAPAEPGYRRLCRLLSLRNEDPAAWRAWTRDDTADLCAGGGPAAEGLIALVRDASDGRRWAAAGAEVWWRAGLRPELRPVPHPIACAPILDHLGNDRLAAPVLAAMRARGTVAGAGRGLALCDLPALKDTYAGREAQLERGAELLARVGWAPGGPAADGSPPIHLPPTPPEWGDMDVRLRARAEAGLEWRYPPEQRAPARQRLEHELTVIRGKRMAGYILTVAAITAGKRTCGRGSGASSIVCYALGITAVDPVRWNLLFERFLAPERMDPPDIDVDFAWDERDAVLAETIRHFGAGHAAMVATHQHLNRDGALREAARAFGLPDAAISAMRDRLADARHYGVLRDGGAVDGLPEPWPAILAAAAAISGAPRHLGLHCGGLVITATPIRDLVSVHPAAKALAIGVDAEAAPTPAIAWEKDGAEDLGLVKIDLLGNRSLAVIRDALDDLRAEGNSADATILGAVDDAATRDLVARGDTLGCFYIESPAMRQLQAKVGSPEFDHLVVHSSIIRPAGSSFIARYIERYHQAKSYGFAVPAEIERTWYPDPRMRGLLSDSFGVLSYQEDVMLVAQRLAGFGSKEANQLRKALGRSDSGQRMQELADRFDAGCQANGVAIAVIDEVWEMISSFAGYSFCKAHSASYAMVSFQCAWLKAHWPAHFLARVIANQGGYYATSAYVEEARRRGVAIHGVCVARSAWKTAPEAHAPGHAIRQSHAIRLGLQLVKGLSRATADAIARERARAPFAGVRDLRQRTGAASDELTTLASAGACDALMPGLNHAQRAWLVAVVARGDDGAARARPRDNQALLDLGAPDVRDPPPPALRDLPPAEVLRRRWAILGCLAEAHPLALWTIRNRPAGRCRDVVAAAQGRRVALVGRAISRKDVSATYLTDRHGEPLAQPRFAPMSFVTIEDETALVETTWFPETYARHAVLLERGEPLRLDGVIEVEHGFATLRVEAASGCVVRHP